MIIGIIIGIIIGSSIGVLVGGMLALSKLTEYEEELFKNQMEKK